MCFFGSQSPTPAPPSVDTAAVQAAALAERQRAAKAKGYASTILTGGQGDTSTAPGAPKTLLGS